MKKNFNDQKGRNGKSRKNQDKGETIQKEKGTLSDNSRNAQKGTPTKNIPVENSPDSDPGKNGPDAILQKEPWREPEKKKEDKNDDRDKNDKVVSTNQDHFKDDPFGNASSEDSAITDPTIDENTIKDSLF